LDFLADGFGQTRVVVLQTLEEEQPRMVPAPVECVTDLAHLLQVAVRMGDENPCAMPLACRIDRTLSKWFFESWLRIKRK